MRTVGSAEPVSERAVGAGELPDRMGLVGPSEGLGVAQGMVLAQQRVIT
jgi:hypothetical protein